MSEVRNAYPMAPEIPFKRTTVEMGEVVFYMKGIIVNKEVKKAAYIIFRNESANGSKGVNNNYAGIQADSGRWPAKFDNHITGTCIIHENQTGKLRRFCCFDSFKTSVDFLIDRVTARGLYVGGNTHLITNQHIATPEDLARIYYKEWVTGSKTYEATDIQKNNFLSMYKQADKMFL